MTEGRRLVVKFGGSVLRTGKDLAEAARLVVEAPAEEKLVVVSAPYGVTNQLAGLTSELPLKIDPADSAQLLSFGERISAHLLTALLRARGASVRHVAPEDPEWPIWTRGGSIDATIDPARSRERAGSRLRPLLARSIVVVEGFLGREGERVTTLKRGGSDTSALALATFLEATDVVLVKGAAGVQSADPRVVPDARTLPDIDTRELSELVHAGLPVVAREALAYLGDGRMRVRVIPFGPPLLGGSGTAVRSGPTDLGRPTGADEVTFGSVTAMLGERPDGLAELVRVLGERPWFGLSASSTSVSVFVPEPEVRSLVQALHATGAFRAVTSRTGVAGPRAERSAEREARTYPVPGRRDSWLPDVDGRPLHRGAKRSGEADA